MRYVIAGSSGFLGSALRDGLARAGHDVVRLVRSDSPSTYASRWDPNEGSVDLDVIESADVVVNLAGSPLARPWTSGQRRAVRDSRVNTTATLANAIASVGSRPAFLAQSAIAAYGSDRGDTVLSESTEPAGGGFLHNVVGEWESATEPAERAGARVCHLRTGVVMDRRGGPMPLMLPAFRLGLAGPLGSGEQYFSVVSLEDWVAAVLFLGAEDTASGAFNLTAPVPPTNAEFTAEMGRRLHRPTRIRVPAVVLRTALGELSGEVLGSLRVVPSRLEEAGFDFRHRDVEQVVAAGLG
ncbi:MAG: TIGR01777 family oxidoreductase [Nocardioidaceae bacterium]